MLPLLAHAVSSELQQVWESQNIGASYFTPGVLSCDLGSLPTNPAWDTGWAFGLLSRTCMCHRPSYSSCVSYGIIAYTSCNSLCCTTTMQYSVVKFWRERFYFALQFGGSNDDQMPTPLQFRFLLRAVYKARVWAKESACITSQRRLRSSSEDIYIIISGPFISPHPHSVS